MTQYIFEAIAEIVMINFLRIIKRWVYGTDKIVVSPDAKIMGDLPFFKQNSQFMTFPDNRLICFG